MSDLLKYFHQNKQTNKQTFQKKYMKMYVHLVRKKTKNLDYSVLVHGTQWHFCISLLCHLLPYLGFHCAFVGEAK